MGSNYIFHSGVGHDGDPPGRGSGRYPWGSGENPGQHQFNLRSEVNRLRKSGLTDSEIAKQLLGQKGVNKKTGEPIWYNSTDLRAQISIETKRERQANRAKALDLLDECHGNVSEVARRMGINESSVRSLLNDAIAERTNKYDGTAEFLKKKIADSEVGIIDISAGSEIFMGCTDHTKKVAVAMLEQEGYVKSWVQYPQVGTDKKTTVMVLAAPPKDGETVRDVLSRIQKNKYYISPIQDFTPDAGKTWWTPEFPESLDSKRVMVRYAEDGGKDKDGVIELRKGVEDISLGGSQYAQVRIAIDGTNYLKGMAIYGDDADFPPGVDVIFNTNKHRGTPLVNKDSVYDPESGEWSGSEVSKRLKINNETGEVDRDNPFGALIKSPKDVDGVLMASGQRHYISEDGTEKLSPINKLRDEGDWDSWSRTLSSQFLSKQPLKLINQQLDLSISAKEKELDDILKLTNPVIQKKLLDEFADNCDANAADLSAKGFKNQAYQVILPVPKMKDTEVYAPNFDDGDTVALIRYPHGGIFEIPVLTVNNKNPEAEKIMKNAKDAIGINPKVAAQLSGADFDGDTALVIPIKSNRIGVSARSYLKELENFDPKELYSLPDDAPRMSSDTKQTEMGKVTNLITDMTVGGASWSEITRAVKHSMVVIDAEKHHLDYKQSAIDNGIDELKRKYQGTTKTGQPAGASTILSKASAETYINKRKEITDTSKMTPQQLKDWNEGKKVYVDSDETSLKLVKDPAKMTSSELERYNQGKKVYRDTGKPKQTKIPRMYTVDDAMDLVRDPSNEKEVAYAKYANNLKGMANEARKASRAIKPTPVSQEAKKTYAKEVESLNAKLRIALSNAPKERQAQMLANAEVSEKLKSNPDMDYEHKQRVRALALTKARAAVGAKKEPIIITDREWEAIQANAISTNKLKQILDNTDQEKFKQRATPRRSVSLTNAEIGLIQSMAASGMYTNKEIADRLRVSVSDVAKALQGLM